MGSFFAGRVFFTHLGSLSGYFLLDPEPSGGARRLAFALKMLIVL
jgi:hypothetical protein